MKAREALLDCLLSGRKALKITVMELTSLPKHLPPGLTVLNVSNNKLSRLPELPRTLISLDASYNILTSLPRYPGSLEKLDISHNKLNLLPALPPGLKMLDVSNNAFTRLPILPAGMTTLDASNNHLTTLPNLPRSLITLIVENNLLSKIPALPVGLLELNVNKNSLTSLPALPRALATLKCNEKVIRDLPEDLASLHIVGNAKGRITKWEMCINYWKLIDRAAPEIPWAAPDKNLNSVLQNLPGGLMSLVVRDTYLASWPKLPQTLISLGVINAGLKTLPMLPEDLQVLNVRYNELESLPKLPDRIKYIKASDNNLKTLPYLPESVEELYVNNNSLTLIPRLPEGLKDLDISNNSLFQIPASRTGLRMKFSGNPNALLMITCWFPDENYDETLLAWAPLLEEVNGAAFVNFLDRLRENIFARPPEFRAYVTAWLNDITVSPVLRERTFGVAREASESHNVRTAFSWNTMQIIRLFHNATHRPGGISPQDFQTLAHQNFRIQRLESHVADVVRGIYVETDPLQVYLNYFNQLKARLDLPDILPRTMTFTRLHTLTTRDLTTAVNMINTAEEKDFASWFYNWLPLHHYLQQDMTVDELDALSIRRDKEKEAQLERLKNENQQTLKLKYGLKLMEREAASKANEIIFGPLARARFDTPAKIAADV